jgi:hypothetical protein
LRQSIDVFFYAAGTVVLSEEPDYYSASEARQAELEAEAWEPEEDETEAMQQEMQDDSTGHVSNFDFYELRSFLEYLANRIFRKDTIHPFLIMKCPFNLVDLLNFFDHWNGILLASENGASATKLAISEVEKFYSETRRREEIRADRIWTLGSSLLVAILSALIGHFLGKF